jgi:aspartate aminotransferase
VAGSATLGLSAELSRLRAAGADIVGFLEGEPDLPCPSEVRAATQRAVRDGQTRYSQSDGLPELKRLIAEKLTRENGVAAGPENILVANGSKQIIYETLQALCGPGDEVIVPRPYWVTIPEAVKLAGATPVFVDCPGHQLSIPLIEAALTKNTRAIVLNSPNNPTGAVYTEGDLRQVAALAVEHDFIILSDEAYEHLVYDGRKHVSVASFSPEIAKRTITIQTFSKSYSMTGFRVGYLSAEPDVVAAVSRIHGHVTGNVCTFAQHGALAALGLGPAFLEERRALFQKRRDLAFDLASKLFDVVKPQGAFYLFCDASKHIGKAHKDSAALAHHLLTQGKVALVPGSAFGLENHLRISYSTGEDQIKKGFARLAEAL